MLDTAELLKKLDIEFYSFTEGGVEPEYEEVTFRDVLGDAAGSVRLSYLLDKRLYKHQRAAFQELSAGKNVVLRSGTGSGKTEAWWLYVVKHKKKALAVYPTLALSHDQLSRLQEYSAAVGLKVSPIDSTARSKNAGKTLSQLKSELRSSDIVVTNPAFLLMDLKRFAAKPSSSLLLGFLSQVNLLVLDEVDFYSPRSLSLLFAMVRVLASITENLQVAVLTATLSNPEDVCALLREYTGRECSVIDGKPFKREDRHYVIIGKDLMKAWLELRRYAGLLQGVDNSLVEALQDYSVFAKNFYKIVEVLRARGVEVPPAHVEPVEVLKHYVDDDYVTLVFTRSINRAEEIYRKLVSELPEEKRGRVASHHHLVSKERRMEVEEKMRQGLVKVVVSPRTLTQGIDIGLVARVVHVGLPDDVREFHQRNGRKGRRRDIPFTETVIFPGSRWDRELLSRGVEVLREWLEKPVEVTLVNRENKYGLLFYSLFKVKSGQKLTAEEQEFLERLGLYEKGTLTKRGEKTWYELNFYELAPPYGIKRVFVGDGGERFLEDISFSDLVEKFQVGCIDYSSDGVVTAIQRGGEGGRAVRRVVVEALNEQTLYRNEALSYVLEEYRKIKAKWGERASVFSDYLRGRLASEAISNVIPPTSGFGLYHKYPWKTVWIVEREHGRVVETEAGTIVLRDRRVIDVPALTAGKYQDYTYGKLVELDPREELSRVRLGLAFLMVFLREQYRLPLFTFSYSLSSLGGRKTLVLWEEECAGLVEKLDWARIRDELESYAPSRVAEIFLLQRDEEAHIEWVGLGGRWDVAKDLAKRVVDYILLSEKIAVTLRNKKLYVPKPGAHLKLCALDVLAVPIDEKGEVVYGYLALFDGEEVTVEKIVKEFYRTSSSGEVQRRLEKLLNQGFRVAVFDLERLREEMHSLGLTFQAALLSGLVQMGLVEETRRGVEKLLGLRAAGLEEIIRNLPADAKTAIGVSEQPSIVDVERELFASRSRLGQRIYRDHEKLTHFLDDASRKLVENYARTVYMLALIAREAEAARAPEGLPNTNT